MSHTKGPWKYEAETKTIRAEVPNYWLASMNSFEGAVDHEANAALIAAAPEMLEALEAAKILLMVLDEYVAKENEYVLESIKAAIRKARGEK